MRRLLFLFVLLAGLSGLAAAPTAVTVPPNASVAVFSGGCFWCIQPPFDKAGGVYATLVGYCGGSSRNPTYEEVSTGATGYRESIEVFYDPARITYKQLLDIYWHNINPTQADGQFYDVGPQYTTAVYYSNGREKQTAEKSKEALAKSGMFKQPIATQVLPLTKFWPAEAHHQKYSLTNPEQYEAYHGGSGRDAYFERTWGGK